jgi:hypothetical protein
MSFTFIQYFLLSQKVQCAIMLNISNDLNTTEFILNESDRKDRRIIGEKAKSTTTFFRWILIIENSF